MKTPPCFLSAVSPSPTNHYRTTWHYRCRRSSGIFVRYEDIETATFEIDVDAPSVADAYTAALPFADARYRNDSDRVSDTLELDQMLPTSRGELAIADKRLRVFKMYVGFTTLALCAVTLGYIFFYHPFSIGRF